MALLYLLYLTLLQLIYGPKRDPNSTLPVPPRALTGNGAWPVLGHTILFHKYGPDTAFLFPPEWREWRCLPWSRQLGDTYCIFVWGQWNIVAKGRENVEKVILRGDLTEGWPYLSPPVTLLGKTCPAILDEDEATCLRDMISGPLSYTSVVKQAPEFAKLAQKCIQEILEGHFNKGEKTTIKLGQYKDCDATRPDEDLMNTSDSNSSDSEDKTHKIRLNALRSYTLDLMHGPVLNLDRDNRDAASTSASQQRRLSHSTVTDDMEKTVRFQNNNNHEKDQEERPELPRQELLLLWMDRLKDGFCDIKFTYGPRWMQIWRLNPYGRALNARRKLESVLTAHIEECEKHIPVHHEKGRATRDPLTSALPLWRITEKYFTRNEHPVMGFKKSKIADSNRNRTRSENDIVPEMQEMDFDAKKIVSNPRHRAQSEPDFVNAQEVWLTPNIKRNTVHSILDQILHSADYEGRGITTVATTEVTLLLWMMMDAGQAWTAMALHLLSKHEEACHEVQAEIDRLEHKYKDRLFTPFVLAKMEKLDNLIFEAMRFCPAFMGGLKTVNETVELDGIQVPKHSTVFLANSHDEESFTIHYDPPKKPEELGMFYPSVDLYGFLPLQGLEIPIMVLQTKIFLIVLLQNHTPFWPGKRHNFVRRMTKKLSKSIRHIRPEVSFGTTQRSRSLDDLSEMERGAASVSAPVTPTRSPQRLDEEPPSTLRSERHLEIRHEERLFTRVPFPEPRRPIQIRPRPDGVLFPASPDANLSKPKLASRCKTR